MIDKQIARFLAAAVRARLNIVITGGTSSGKTVLLRALMLAIPPSQRIVAIEETSDAVDLVVSIDKKPNSGRFVSSIVEIGRGYDSSPHHIEIFSMGSDRSAELRSMAARLEEQLMDVGWPTPEI